MSTIQLDLPTVFAKGGAGVGGKGWRGVAVACLANSLLINLFV